MKGLTTYKNIVIYAIELCLCYSVVNYALSKLELSGLPGVRYVDLLFLFLCCVIILLNVNKHQSSASKLLLSFAICCIPSLFAFDQYSLSFHNLTTLFIPFLSYQVGSIISQQEGINKSRKYITFIVALVIVLVIAANQYTVNPMTIVAGRDFAFALIVLSSFLFLIKNRVLKIVLQILTLLVILISIKRSLILGLVLALVLYYFISIYWNKNYKLGTKMWLTLLIVILGYGVFTYMGTVQDINDTIEERFTNMSEDGGSGRDYIYETIIDKIEASSTSQLLFGHGYNAVTTKIFEHPAHNDVLEIMYDHGLIAVLIWLTFVLIIGYKAVRLIIKGEIEQGSIIISIWVMWVMTFFTNCIYVNSSLSAAFYLFFGLFDYQTINTLQNHSQMYLLD